MTVIGPSAIQFEPMTGGMPTKGTSIQDGNALLFNWAIGDTLGIFPNRGNQVEFPISAAQGTTSASFDGGGWALRNNASYAAYYPFSVWNYHPDDVTNISWAAFYASEINQITLPSALETIGGIAFYNCSNITELVIPANVGSIGVQAFMGCTGLTKVTVNNPVPIEIDEGVFDNTNDCPIYVPNASVDAYKFAPGWSDYSGRIFGINVDGSVVGPDPEYPD